jgi:hypothetical protein
MNEDKVIINFNNREYKADDLNDEQMQLAIKLNKAAKQLVRLQDSADTYALINEHKNMLIEQFDKTLTKEDETKEE